MRRPFEALRSYWQTGFNPKTYSRDPEFLKLWAPGGLFYDSGSSSGVYVTPELAMTFSAVYDAVNQISSDIAKLPLNLHKRLKGGGSEVFDGSKVHRLLKYEPNPEMGSMVFRRQMMVWALTSKGALAEIERDGAGRPLAIWPIEPHRWRAWRQKLQSRDGAVTYGPLQYVVDGRDVFDLRDVVHIAGIGPEPDCAWSILDLARTAIGLALSSERFGSKFYENGSQFGGLLLTDQTINDTARKALLEQIEKYHKGARNAGKLGVFGGGFKYFETHTKPQEAQMEELRARQIAEVARFFNIPLYKLKSYEDGAVSYSSVEMYALDYYKGCLLNWITLWEEELNRKLISPLEQNIQFIKHNANAFLRGDIQSRYAALAVARDRGIINADEWRELEDMNPQPNGQGQLYTIQSGFVPVDRLNDIVDKQTEPTPPPPPPSGNADVGVANERAALAEKMARDAEERAVKLREEIAALAATGTADKAEIERMRTAEHAAIAEAATSHQIAEDWKARAASAQSERDAANAAKMDAEQRATDAIAREAAAVAAKAEADAAVADAIKVADEKRAEAEAAAKQLATTEGVLEHAINGRAELEAKAEAERQKAGKAEERALAAELHVNGLADAAILAAERESEAKQAAQDARSALEIVTNERNDALAAKGQADERAERARAEAQDATLLADMAQSQAEAARTAEAESRGVVTTLKEQIASLAERVEALSAIEIRSTEQAAELAQAHAALTDARTALEAAKHSQQAAQEAQSEAIASEKATNEQLAFLLSAQERGVADVVAAHRALLVHVMRGAIERETDRVRKNQQTPDKLRAWMAKWYDSHAALMESALLPAVSVHLAWMRSSENAGDVTRRFVAEHIAESKRQLEAVLDGDAEPLATSLTSLLYRWEQERVTVVADALMQQEIEYATRRRTS